MAGVPEQGTHAPEIKGDSPRYLRWFMSILLAVLFLYLLSIGPVARMCGLTSPVLDTYRPVIRLSDRSLATERILYWYLSLWGVDIVRYQ